ncbi:lysophospholipid acyltransferase family protein [Spongiibacter taiwanensis]|uniref:GNAT family N-acyltransferase n=1 Tax=Spongiibacter taiwanensis TaxID=1748242 RepID=UPI00203584A8|nr:lysophospholipid acyltransferase family protein [Spongiibacter taiwanensis]USA43860.1 lysophospholipid acyltransferase family protein [Spongiibacter taiwanensis]
MISVDSVINERLPRIAQGSPRIRKTVSALLKYLFHEAEFKQFERDYPYLQGLDFVDKALEYFDFSYAVSALDKERIPVSGRLVIISNHPIGSLDGLALLKLVSEVRGDVKVVANELLYALKPLRSLLLPVDNMSGKRNRRENINAIHQHLEGEGAVIIFPAGEVSRFGPQGVRDGRWRNGFIKFSEKTAAPVLPVHINARNSVFFYALSLLAKPLSTLWLIREMFKQNNRTVRVSIGPAIEAEVHRNLPLTAPAKVRLFKKHIYKLGSRKRRGEPCFMPVAQPVAHPEDRQELRRAIRACDHLGSTRDGMEIYCYQYSGDCTIMREIGRLREISFRAVGEGTGHRRDVDAFDAYYDHIVLWDENQLELVGAYRLKRVATLEANESLYSSTLFDYKVLEAEEVFEQGAELGRSFVQPRYWGRNALDYLWQGLGRYLHRYPEVRYLFGPVSVSDKMPRAAKDLLVAFYRSHFSSTSNWASAKMPYRIEGAAHHFAGEDYTAEFAELKEKMAALGCAVPTLYKQYTELCDDGGVSFADFNIDPDFADCIDGLVLVDIEKMKPARRKRYLGSVAVDAA